jgi:hypothetical protein
VLKLPLAGPGRGPSPWDSQLRVSRGESGLQCPLDSLLLRETQDLPQDSLLQSRSEAPGTGRGLSWATSRLDPSHPTGAAARGGPRSAASARAAAAVRLQAQRSRPGLSEENLMIIISSTLISLVIIKTFNNAHFECEKFHHF